MVRSTWRASSGEEANVILTARNPERLQHGANEPVPHFSFGAANFASSTSLGLRHATEYDARGEAARAHPVRGRLLQLWRRADAELQGVASEGRPVR